MRSQNFARVFKSSHVLLYVYKKKIPIQRLDLLELYSKAGSAKVLLQQITGTKCATFESIAGESSPVDNKS